VTADEQVPPGDLAGSFSAAASQLGLPAHACVAVAGASQSGLSASRVAGMPAVLLGEGLPSQGSASPPVAIYPSLKGLTVAGLQALSYSSPGPQLPTSSRQQGSAAANSSVGWLDQSVGLPAGYRTTRRELLKLLPLGGALGCVWVAATRFKAMSFASPQALINAVVPSGPDPATLSPSAGSERVQAFKRYILELEGRGGGKAVPDFPFGLDWLNTSGPLSLKRQLKGKLVVLDFWTYCCINCMHVLPDLAAIEKRFCGGEGSRTSVAVVGVHSAKFDNEKNSDAIRDAVLRYNIEHPVVNDGRMQMWGALGVSSWPTLAVVSPKGRLIAMLVGEGHRADLEDLLEAGLQVYGEAGLLDDTPLPLALERNRPAGPPSPLRYPGKLAVDAAGGRLFITDSNNHRIVVTTLDGRFLEHIGGNGAALVDGSYESAAFNRPQGLAYSSTLNSLFVADTENHALRCVDLSNRTVTTLAGDGTKGGDYRGGGRGRTQQLNSPWDVLLVEPGSTSGAAGSGATLYIAMAGTHQIWSHDVASGVTQRFSGTGAERNQNGSTALTTSWAQPSGLALLNPRSMAGAESGVLVVADSESSSVRALDLSTGGASPLAGGDPFFSDNLFRFGDQDGAGADALLQHPLAVCTLEDGTVLVADSYNHRIKVLEPDTCRVTTLVGGGRPGFKDGSGTNALLSEPAGLVAGPPGSGKVYVADTNNSQIRVLDVASKTLSTLQLSGVPPPRQDPFSVPVSEFGAFGASSSGAPPAPAGAKVVPGQLAVVAGSGGQQEGSLVLRLVLPEGYHLTKGAGSGFTTQVYGSEAGQLEVRPGKGLLPDTPTPTLNLKYKWSGSSSSGGKPSAVLRVLSKVYFCVDGGACLFEEVCFDISIQPSADVSSTGLVLEHALSAGAALASEDQLLGMGLSS